ncbi:CYFA0S01e09428g1_1 [Cyberlindnera fabianii]|uniref:CYFA0S01e09428g1_1 n=1 Tax=Cyberlindnera fabianii TaxID=36022 RepID=A0A061ARF5_CYBFA|nr:CYFA0S01e09428g1_1 [Cyberlindnera fabianii]
MVGLIGKSLLAGGSFAIGFASFARAWPEYPDPTKDKRALTGQRADVLESLKSNPQFTKLMGNADFVSDVHSSRIPKPHQNLMVSQGLLFGPNHLEIDPIVFINRKDNELQSFYHLGKDLTSYDGVIHNGVLSTIIDESLTFCGFPLLPSKRGVTAKLAVNFIEHVEPDSTIILKAKVKEHKGRKVVIEGFIETLDPSPVKVATAECILVEPKWFKYFSWLQLF